MGDGGYPIYDADNHLYETAECFTRHLDKSIAREAIAYQKQLLRPKWFSMSATSRRWKWLQGLEPSRLVDDVLYVHASPRDPLTEYVEEVR